MSDYDDMTGAEQIEYHASIIAKIRRRAIDAVRSSPAGRAIRADLRAELSFIRVECPNDLPAIIAREKAISGV